MFKISKLGSALALPFLLLIIFELYIYLTSSSQTASRPVLLHVASLPWKDVLIPVRWIILQITGNKTSIGFDIYAGLCTLLNAVIAYRAGQIAAYNKRSVLGASMSGIYVLLCAAALIYILANMETQNMAGIIMVILTQPWSHMFAGLFSSAVASVSSMVFGAIFNTVLIYCFASMIGFYYQNIKLKYISTPALK